MLEPIARLALLALLATAVCSLGCSSLGPPKPGTSVLGAQPNGVHSSGTTSGLIQSTKRAGNRVVSAVKSVLPGPERSPLVDTVAKDDPTRLDNMPAHISPDLYVAAARLSERNGRFQQAYEQYQMALEQNKDDRDALIGLARLHHRRGDIDVAIETYLSALNVYRDDPVMLNDLGLCYARKGQLHDAIGVLQAAVQIAPDRELYANNLASCLVEADQLQDAVHVLSRLQGPARAHCSVGYLLDQRGRRNEAEQHLRQALAMEPSMYQARALLEDTPRLSARPTGPMAVPRVPSSAPQPNAATFSHLPSPE